MNRIFALNIAGVILTSAIANATGGVTVQSLLDEGFKIVAVQRMAGLSVYLQKDNKAYECEYENHVFLCHRFGCTELECRGSLF